MVSSSWKLIWLDESLAIITSPVELEFKMDVRARSEIFIGIAQKYHSNWRTMFCASSSLCVLQNKCSKPKSAKIGHFFNTFSHFTLKISVLWWNCIRAKLQSTKFSEKWCGLKLKDLIFLRHRGRTINKKWSNNSYFLQAHSKLKILIYLNGCFAFEIFNSLPFECRKPELNISFTYRVM